MEGASCGDGLFEAGASTLRAYAQKQPKQEYKREAFELFESLLYNVKVDVIRFLSKVQFQADENAQALEDRRRAEAARSTMVFQKSETPGEAGSVR